MAVKADRWDPNDQGPDDDDEEEGPATNGRTPAPPPPSRGGGAPKGSKGGGLMSSTKGAAKGLGKTGPGRQGKAIAHETGNVLVGLVIYAIGINYLRYGPAGVKAYFAAKLTNKPSQPGNGVPTDTAQTGPVDYVFRKARNAVASPAPTITTAPPSTEAAPAPSNAGRNFA